jgi:lipopolysaccharide transport system ATP-binding protein
MAASPKISRNEARREAFPVTTFAIRLNGLGKEYPLRHGRTPYKTAREALVNVLSGPFRGLRSGSTTRSDAGAERFWALKDVSFDVAPGEVVGIIGRNGAGKSTLLKILSRITDPSEGSAEICGRVGSLLDVGIGFHAELTGRENIFMNGAILGMKRAEIVRRFDEIAAFAETEKFLDTAVKHYSSGMYLRLAFAVAAHLEPEILIVDEVLAVGDAAFQRKCLGKMGQVANEGRTVLLVSHNMQAITTLCRNAVLLEGGRVAMLGASGQVVSAYIQSDAAQLEQRHRVFERPSEAPGNETVRIRAIRVVPADAPPNHEIGMTTPLRVEIDYWNLLADATVLLELDVYTLDGTAVFESLSVDDPTWHARPLPVGLFRSVALIPGHFLNQGSYRLRVVFIDEFATAIVFDYPSALVFTVHDLSPRRISWYGRHQGVVRPRLEWQTDPLCIDQFRT